ncbi:amidase signature enzyme [Massarina eburnea CBS 473.64]|uniref:Amidase signature enzyme n=1 Tax=Massarina eburnea CBS 473.64 TaxID=1395130 RepID=A0A6A6S5D2_9PLEO|nr:amidase signature enzyme [Massarina eburnea CBS 473.64]
MPIILPAHPAIDNACGVASTEPQSQFEKSSSAIHHKVLPPHRDHQQGVTGRENEAVYPNVWIHLRLRADVAREAFNPAKIYYEKPHSPLYDIPLAVKDGFDVIDIPSEVACFPCTYTSIETDHSVVSLLEANVLLVGKTNVDQLAFDFIGCRPPNGSTASVFGQLEYIPVAAQMVSLTLGTDTTGSGLIPTALNGIIVFHPTKGKLSARGIVPVCKVLDSVSILATCVSNMRDVWQAIDHHDPEDAYAKYPSDLPLVARDYRGVDQARFTSTLLGSRSMQPCISAVPWYFFETVVPLQFIGEWTVPVSDANTSHFQRRLNYCNLAHQ